MNTVTLSDLSALLITMDRKQVSVLARAVLGIRSAEDAAAVSPLNQLKAGLWEFMHAVGFVTDAQARKVLERAEPALKDLVPIFGSADSGLTLPVALITFAEQRWVTCPLRDKWYDMLYDAEADFLPEPAVLLVSCDLTAMFLRQRKWLGQLTKGTDAEPQHHAGVKAGREPDGAEVRPVA